MEETAKVTVITHEELQKDYASLPQRTVLFVDEAHEFISLPAILNKERIWNPVTSIRELEKVVLISATFGSNGAKADLEEVYNG